MLKKFNEKELHQFLKTTLQKLPEGAIFNFKDNGISLSTIKNLSEVFANDVKTLAAKKKIKFDISDSDLSSVEHMGELFSVSGSDKNQSVFVNIGKTLNREFPNLKNITNLFWHQSINEPFTLRAPKLRYASGAFMQSTINAPIKIEAPELVIANSMLKWTSVKKPVSISAPRIGVVRDNLFEPKLEDSNYNSFLQTADNMYDNVYSNKAKDSLMSFVDGVNKQISELQKENVYIVVKYPKNRWWDAEVSFEKAERRGGRYYFSKVEPANEEQKELLFALKSIVSTNMTPLDVQTKTVKNKANVLSRVRLNMSYFTGVPIGSAGSSDVTPFYNEQNLQKMQQFNDFLSWKTDKFPLDDTVDGDVVSNLLKLNEFPYAGILSRIDNENMMKLFKKKMIKC